MRTSKRNLKTWDFAPCISEMDKHLVDCIKKELAPDKYTGAAFIARYLKLDPNFERVLVNHPDCKERCLSVIYRVGGRYLYQYPNNNRSAATVEIVAFRDDSRGVASVRFLRVLNDDSGNGFFSFLEQSGNTMNVSLQYLVPLRTK